MVVEEVIIVKNFVKRYGDFEVVRGISFMVKWGGFCIFWFEWGWKDNDSENVYDFY